MAKDKSRAAKKRKVPVVVVVLVWLIALAAIAVVLGYSVVTGYLKPMTMDGEETYSVEYRLPAGRTVMEVSHDLEDLKLVRKWQAFYYAMRFGKYFGIDSASVKTGFYNLDSSMSIQDLAQALSTGAPEYITVTIPEGLTIKKTALVMEENDICSVDDFVAACHSRELIEKYNVPSDSLEGFLYPDTYYFVKGCTTEEAVEKLVDTFFERVKDIENLKDADPDELYRILRLASIVEREYKSASEAPLIASVFLNRIKIGMKLESCATVEYIITEIEGKPHPTRLFYADLERDSPFNTYKKYGLPPSPISNPGLTALTAASNPEKSDYYYFVLSDESAGTHTFTKTLSQHNAAKYLQTKK